MSDLYTGGVPVEAYQDNPEAAALRRKGIDIFMRNLDISEKTIPIDSPTAVVWADTNGHFNEFDVGFNEPNYEDRRAWTLYVNSRPMTANEIALAFDHPLLRREPTTIDPLIVKATLCEIETVVSCAEGTTSGDRASSGGD